MSESFAELFEESLTRSNMKTGQVISAEVVRIDHNFVVVNAGLKSEAFIPVEEFQNDQGELEVNPGDFVSVAIDALENGYGDTILSRDKAKRLASWMNLEKALEGAEIVTGTVTGKVKGGLTVMVNGIRAFLPGSLVDTRPIKDTSPYEGKTMEFKVIKLDRKRNNVVLSRRAVVEASQGEERAKMMSNLQEGSVVQGTIKNITDYGAFVDLGGIDGLLHITDLAWRRVRHPSEMLTVGQEVTAKILKFDQEKNRVSLGIKQLGDDPWVGIARRYPPNTRLFGKATNLTDYGAFVDLGGIDGLLHITDMAWKRIKHPSEVVEVGQEVTVKVLKFDKERNRVSLGLKQLGEDPWLAIMNRYPKGSIVKARVTNLTDYGCFAEIAEGVEGLVHVSEMDHTNKNIHPSKVVQIGDEVDVMVLEVDEERRRISLGIKQTRANPWEEFAKNHDKGEKVSGTIKSITDFGIFIGLPGGIDGLVHLSDISWNEQGEEAIRRYKKGDTVEAVILSVDAEGNRISLGIKQLNSDPFNDFLAANERGALVKGTVTAVDAKGATVKLADDIEATLKASEINRDRVEDATKFLEVGQEVEAKIINVDRKSRSINLSIKAKDEAEEKEAVNNARQAAAAQVSEANGPKTIGDLIKAQMK